VTEYCAVIGTHSTVRGDKLLYGLIPDPFPRCGIGSGHARLGAIIAAGKNGVSAYVRRENGARKLRTFCKSQLLKH